MFDRDDEDVDESEEEMGEENIVRLAAHENGGQVDVEGESEEVEDGDMAVGKMSMREIAATYLQTLELALQNAESYLSTQPNSATLTLPFNEDESKIDIDGIRNGTATLDMDNVRRLRRRVVSVCARLDRTTTSESVMKFDFLFNPTRYAANTDGEISDDQMHSSEELAFDDPARLASQLLRPLQTSPPNDASDILYALDAQTPIIDISTLIKMQNQRLDFWQLVSALGKQRFRVHIDAVTCRRVWLRVSKHRYVSKNLNSDFADGEGEESLECESDMDLVERQIRQERLEQEKWRIVKGFGLNAQGLLDAVSLD